MTFAENFSERLLYGPGFSIVRANAGVNPYYLYYALRLASTLEQFRKWSTGSSYPAILDDDVNKTLIPVPPLDVQDQLARRLAVATQQRDQALTAAKAAWKDELQSIEQVLRSIPDQVLTTEGMTPDDSNSEAEIRRILGDLPPLITDNGSQGSELEQKEFSYDEDESA